MFICKRCKKWFFFSHSEDGLCEGCIRIIAEEKEEEEWIERERVLKEQQERIEAEKRNLPPLAEKIAAAEAAQYGSRRKIKESYQDRTFDR